MGNVYADVGVTDVSGCIDGCRYTLVLAWKMLVGVLMVKLHLSQVLLLLVIV